MKKCGRLTALLLAGLLTLSGALAGCSETTAEEEPVSAGQTPTAETPETEAAEEETEGFSDGLEDRDFG